MVAYKVALISVSIAILVIFDSAQACQCSGVGTPCRYTHRRKRFCFVADPYRCNEVHIIHVTMLFFDPLFISYEPCNKRFEYPQMRKTITHSLKKLIDRKS